MSLHTWPHQDPRKSSSHATFMLNSHWGRAATSKRKKKKKRERDRETSVYVCRVTLVVPDFL